MLLIHMFLFITLLFIFNTCTSLCEFTLAFSHSRFIIKKCIYHILCWNLLKKIIFIIHIKHEHFKNVDDRCITTFKTIHWQQSSNSPRTLIDISHKGIISSYFSYKMSPPSHHPPPALVSTPEVTAYRASGWADSILTSCQTNPVKIIRRAPFPPPLHSCACRGSTSPAKSLNMAAL